MSRYRSLPVKERYNLFKAYRTANPDMSYDDMIKDFDSDVSQYSGGGNTNPPEELKSNIQSSEDFLRDMSKSPLFQERFQRMTGISDSQEAGKYSEWINKNLDTLKYEQNGKKLERAKAHGAYSPGKHKITLSENRPSTITHEMSHGSTRGEILNGKKYKMSDNSLLKPQEKYYTDPTEIKARVDVTRKYLLDNNIYDPINERFSKDHYYKLVNRILEEGKENFENSSNSLELLNSFDEDIVIDIMNSFVDKGQSSTINYAAFGGYIPQYALGGETDPPNKQGTLPPPSQFGYNNQLPSETTNRGNIIPQQAKPAIDHKIKVTKDLESMDDDKFKQVYGTGKHRYKYDNNPEYKAKIDAETKERVKTTGAIDYPGTNIQSKSYVGNPNMAFATNKNATSEGKRDAEMYHSDIISAALPIPGLNQVGKVPGLLDSGLKATGKLLTTQTPLKITNKGAFADFPKIDPEKLKDAKGFLNRRQFVKTLQEEGLVGKEFNLSDVNYAARSSDKTDALTKLALERKHTAFRNVTGQLPEGGKGIQDYTGNRFDMNRPASGQTISEMDNMRKAGVDFNDPKSIAEYQATHIPLEDYGYRSTGEHPTDKYGFLFRSSHPVNSKQYGSYQFKSKPNLDFTSGNSQEWLKKYHSEFNYHLKPTDKFNYSLNDRDFSQIAIWRKTDTPATSNSTLVGKRGLKAFEIDKGFPFQNLDDLSPAQQLELKEYAKKYKTQYETGWRGEYKHGGYIDWTKNY